MDLKDLDHPLVLSTLFYPRPGTPGSNTLDNVHDGTLSVADDVVLGYRLYRHRPDAPLVVFFHGNGEIASDYDGIAPEYHRAGASLLVVDFRGYGWSTGKPLVSALLADVEPLLAALPDELQAAGVTPPAWLVMGRSLGSACAIHAAHQHPEQFKGLIVESGFARATRLLARLGLPARMLEGLPDPVGNERKIAQIELPLLVIHGERDTIIPVENGQALYEASPAEDKRLVRIPHAGHNDLLFYGGQPYFQAIRQFVDDVC
jgi:alpha-beta hydrolase superfamily lysophospholipase